MIFDLVVAVILMISAVISFIRGFIREVLTIAGVVGGLAAAYLGGPVLAPVMRSWFGLEDGAEAEVGKLMGVVPYTLASDVLAYASIFLIVVIVISVFSHFIAEGARSIGLGPVDRTLGVIFGIARGVLLLGLFYLPFHLFLDQDSKDKFFEDSHTHFYLEKTAEIFAGLLPEGTKDVVEEGAEDVEDAVTTRDRLKEINLLKGKDGLNSPSTSAGTEPGYGDQFRDQMNELFEMQQEEDSRKGRSFNE